MAGNKDMFLDSEGERISFGCCRRDSLVSSIVDEAKDAGTPTARSDAKKRLIKNELTMGVYVADCTSVSKKNIYLYKYHKPFFPN